MRPHFCSSMVGTQARNQRNTPIKLISMALAHSSASIVAICPTGPTTPALLIKIVMGPRACVTAVYARVIAAPSDKSHVTAMLRLPLAWTSLATCSISALVLAITATSHPSLASSSAIARPIPRPPPVTSATFPCNSFIIQSFR